VKHPSARTLNGPDHNAVGYRTRTAVEASLQGLGFISTEDLFGPRIEKFASLVSLWGRRTNLTARPSDARELARHIVDSLMPIVMGCGRNPIFLRNPFRSSAEILDLGSGAGFPGLVLACASEARFTLVESRLRRASFLRFAVSEIGLTNVTVRHMRATRSSFWEQFDVVTMRGTGALAALWGIAAAALKSGGVSFVYASPAQSLDLTSADSAGLVDHRSVPYEVEVDGELSRSRLILCGKVHTEPLVRGFKIAANQ